MSLHTAVCPVQLKQIRKPMQTGKLHVLSWTPMPRVPNQGFVRSQTEYSTWLLILAVDALLEHHFLSPILSLSEFFLKERQFFCCIHSLVKFYPYKSILNICLLLCPYHCIFPNHTLYLSSVICFSKLCLELFSRYLGCVLLYECFNLLLYKCFFFPFCPCSVFF